MGRISFLENAFASPGSTEYLAYFWRQSASLPDAVRRWSAENPSIPSAGSSEGLSINPEAAVEALEPLIDQTLRERDAVKQGGLDQLGPLRDVPMSEAFPGLADALKNAKDPFEALLACAPTGSAERRMAELLQKQFLLTSRSVGLSALADRAAVHSERELRNYIATGLLHVLGESGDDYDLALLWMDAQITAARMADRREALSKAKVRFLAELTDTLLPLIFLFADPKHFFCVQLPRADLKEIQRPVTEILERWGVAALLNPDVLAAFSDAATKPGFSRYIAAFERREAFRGSGGAPRGRRPDVRDYATLAAEYYGLPRSERKSWLKRELDRPPFISQDSLTRLLSKHRPL